MFILRNLPFNFIFNNHVQFMCILNANKRALKVKVPSTSGPSDQQPMMSWLPAYMMDDGVS